jgi:circadian clock protein KaiC
LDEVLGGGLPEFSFNLIAGGPGCGKTTLAHQFMFANANEGQKALYFTILGEPPIKMLRYQQQFEFFDPSKINGAIRFIHLGQEMTEKGLNGVMARIEQELDRVDARIVIVDSFRSATRAVHLPGQSELSLDQFVQILALTLTSHEATTFLVGEYLEHETQSNPVFTVADGIIWLYQRVVRNSALRGVQVVKMRGQSPISGFHTLRLSQKGIRVFSRTHVPAVPFSGFSSPVDHRKRTGVPGLDEMLHGGIPAGYSVVVAGPPGSGKTVLAAQFVSEGVRQGEPAVIAAFGKRPDLYLRSNALGNRLEPLLREGRIRVVHLRPLDLSVEETLEDLREEVTRLGAKRLVIDSLSGFELALAPSFRDDFRESLYRFLSALTALGVTVLLTVEVTDSFTELRLSAQGASLLTDGIILQRYIEVDGDLRKVMAVIKMRASPHGTELREYEVTEKGIVVANGRLEGYRGILTGLPRKARRSESRSASRRHERPKE